MSKNALKSIITDIFREVEKSTMSVEGFLHTLADKIAKNMVQNISESLDKLAMKINVMERGQIH